MEVNRSLFRFNSADGKNKVQGYLYVPEGELRGILQISHGMSEYFLRYDDFAQFMARHGYVVCGNDHLGHGATVAVDADYGHISDENGWQYMLEDLHTVTKKIRKKFPKLPFYLLGHSMGSFLARLYLAEYPEEADAAIIMGTSGDNQSLPLGLCFCNLTISLQGYRHRSLMLDYLAFGAYNRRIPQNETKFDWLSRDHQVVEAYIADPKCGFVFTASSFKAMFTLLQKISNKGWVKALNPELPVYMLAGKMDPVGNYGQGVKVVFEKMKQHGMQDVTLKLYPGARHELLNETNRQEVYEDILSWLERKGSNQDK